MANMIMVDYDLNVPGQKYDAVAEYLKQWDWVRPLKSKWLIKTERSGQEIFSGLMDRLDVNDGVMVTDVTNSNLHWSDGISAEATDAIKTMYHPWYLARP